jgi:hypothetical protein
MLKKNERPLFGTTVSTRRHIMYFEVGWLLGILLLSQVSNEWIVVRASFGGVMFSAIGLIPFITNYRLRGPLTWFGSALFVVALPNVRLKYDVHRTPNNLVMPDANFTPPATFWPLKSMIR